MRECVKSLTLLLGECLPKSLTPQNEINPNF